MFLNILKRGPVPPEKKLRIKTYYTHCTYNFNAKVTDDFFQNPLPADQQLGRQQLNALWTISNHPAKKFVNLMKQV